MQESFDNQHECNYTKDELMQAATLAAQTAIAGMMPRFEELDNSIRELSDQMNERTEDMAKYRARVKQGLETQWVSADNLQALIDKAIALHTASARASALFTEYAEDYMNTYKSNGSVQLNTLNGYKGYLQNHIYPAFNGVHLHEIDTLMIQQYINSKSATLSVKTIKEHLQLLNMIFQAAVEDGQMLKNPCASKRLQVVGKSSVKVDAYTEAEYKQLESMIPVMPDTAKLLLAMSLYTGMRQGEMFALRWENVDLNKDVIHVIASAEWPSQNQAIIKTPKTDNGYRDIPIIPQLADVLKGYVREDGYVLRGAKQTDDVPMTRQGVKRLNDRINTIASRNNVHVKFLSHRARHSVATILNNAGADDVSITSILGHADVSFTKRQYVSRQDQQIRRGMDTFSKAVAGILARPVQTVAAESC